MLINFHHTNFVQNLIFEYKPLTVSHKTPFDPLSLLQVTVTPFLHDEFDKSISYGGFVLINVSVGMTLGSVITGVLLQNKALKPGTIMAFGALFVCLGILATFPPRACAALYELAPVSAFVGVFLASMGEPLITIASLRELYDLQVIY